MCKRGFRETYYFTFTTGKGGSDCGVCAVFSFFFSFFNSVLRPFQVYFISYETGQSVGGVKTGDPQENQLAHPCSIFMLTCILIPCFEQK